MKKLIFCLALFLSLCSCKAQEFVVDPPRLGHAIGLVTQVTEGTVTLATLGGALELEGELEKGVEYEVIYEITERGVIMKGVLVDYEISFGEFRKRKARLLRVLEERNRQ